MNQTDFSQLPLRDIHLPGAVGWWPPALGWWLLLALALSGLALYAWQLYRGRHRRAALRGLARIRTALEGGVEPVVCLQNASTILRRFAMTSAARTDAEVADVPGLVGERWLEYLDGLWGRREFTTGIGRRLLAAPYARPSSIDRTAALELTAVCAAWLAAQPVTPRAGARAKGA